MRFIFFIGIYNAESIFRYLSIFISHSAIAEYYLLEKRTFHDSSRDLVPAALIGERNIV